MDRRSLLKYMISLALPVVASCRADSSRKPFVIVSPEDLPSSDLIRLFAEEADRGDPVSYASIATAAGVPKPAAADLIGVPASLFEEGESSDTSTIGVVRGAQRTVVPQGQTFESFIRRNKAPLLRDRTDSLAARWAPLAESIDYWHVAQYETLPGDFVLGDKDLRWLLEKNSFSLRDENPLVLFGLRGCEIRSGADETKWQRHLSLRWTRPDHRNFKCVIGVWDQTRRRLRAFRASTVPNQENMYRYLRSPIIGDNMCNLLPCGLYEYQAGTHRNKDHGCFRMDSRAKVVVLRTITDLTYRSTDNFELWHETRPGDNIHSSYFTDRGSNPQFSSAGCQVVFGSHKENRPTDAWQEFRVSAGLDTTPNERDKRPYQYILLTGLEAALAASRDKFGNIDYECLRFGSRGLKVSDLQKRLGVASTAFFDSATAMAVRNTKASKGLFESTCVSLSDDAL